MWGFFFRLGPGRIIIFFGMNWDWHLIARVRLLPTPSRQRTLFAAVQSLLFVDYSRLLRDRTRRSPECLKITFPVERHWIKNLIPGQKYHWTLCHSWRYLRDLDMTRHGIVAAWPGFFIKTKLITLSVQSFLTPQCVERNYSSHTVNQSINQSINPSINPSINQSINPSINQPIKIIFTHWIFKSVFYCKKIFSSPIIVPTPCNFRFFFFFLCFSVWKRPLRGGKNLNSNTKKPRSSYARNKSKSNNFIR